MALPGIQWEWNRFSGPSSFELGAAFQEWRCLRRPRAGGARFLHYHTHSKASSPLGLPQRNAGLPTNRPWASLQTGLPPGQARRGAVESGVRG